MRGVSFFPQMREFMLSSTRSELLTQQLHAFIQFFASHCIFMDKKKTRLSYSRLIPHNLVSKHVMKLNVNSRPFAHYNCILYTSRNIHSPRC